MKPIIEEKVWSNQIEMMEVGDKVLGGEDGPINQPLKALTNRTAFLKALLAVVIEKAGLELGRFDDVGLLVAAIEKIVSAGCVESAAKLTTSRLVGGVAFDGTADIHLPVSVGFNSNQLYQAGDLVKVDGEWYECYHPDGIKGRDPRDPLNRPAGWQITDQSKPYYWLKIGKWLSFPEVGSPIYLPTTSIREGLIKYRNDGKLHKNKFWRLAELYPDLIENNFINIADLRAEFIRGLDDGRGLDMGRLIGSAQGDAIRNIVGQSEVFHVQTLGNRYGTDGAIQTVKSGVVGGAVNAGASNNMSSINFDASRVVPTANENRSRNLAMLEATRN